MDEQAASQTGSSLFDVQRNPLDATARARFAVRYRPKIYGWARGCGLSEADADDVAQELLLKLLDGIRTYDPNKGKFRNWLKVATRNTTRDFRACERRARSPATDEKLRAILARPEASEALDRLTDAMFDQETFRIACQRVQMQASREAWQAFRRRAFEDVPVATVARDLDMTEAAVCQACYRIKNQLREEIRRLDEGPASAGEER